MWTSIEEEQQKKLYQKKAKKGAKEDVVLK